MPMETTMEDVQRMYGKALVAANKYTAQIAAQATAEEETIAALFTSEEPVGCVCEGRDANSESV